MAKVDILLHGPLFLEDDKAEAIAKRLTEPQLRYIVECVEEVQLSAIERTLSEIDSHATKREKVAALHQRSKDLQAD